MTDRSDGTVRQQSNGADNHRGRFLDRLAEAQGGLPHETQSALGDEAERVLLALGAGLVLAWNEVPQDTQQRIFESAVFAGDPAQAGALRAELATFLHRHKDDAVA